ncbi:MAG: glycosyltransferase [Candidatus Aenigmarchaeota archaeon]|nr:glycosyltransferase [Candidatus Aenigmarchaeota archaeon]
MKFIIVSRLEKIKNIDIVIKVFNKLKDDELWIVGKGKYENELKKLAKAKNIKFFGFVDEKTLKKLYKEADVCIMPHINEPFGLVPYEIAKFGKPSIISKLSGIAELAKEYKFGLIFDPYDENDLLEKIKTIKIKKIYRQLSKNANNLKKYINPNTEFKKFLEHIPKNTKRILIIHSQFIEIGGAEKSIIGMYEKLKRIYNCEIYFEIDKNYKKWKILYKSKIRKITYIFRIFNSLSNLIKKFKNNDIVIVSLTGNILSIPAYWSSLILGNLINKKIIIYLHEIPISFRSLTKIEKILLFPIIFLDILLTKVLIQNNYIIIANSKFLRKHFIKRYKKTVKDIIYPIFHL